jgi:hypothetical protein
MVVKMVGGERQWEKEKKKEFPFLFSKPSSNERPARVR